eukprot:c43469_g1_i1 orf=156-326(-)
MLFHTSSRVEKPKIRFSDHLLRDIGCLCLHELFFPLCLGHPTSGIATMPWRSTAPM